MRLTTVLLIASLVQVSAATFGQNITLNEQNVSLESLFKKIRKQSGYNFYFDGRVVTPELKGSIKVTNVSIEEALKDVMAGHPLSYEIKDKLVIIKRKETSILESLISRFQEIDVTGKVTDESGAPLAGANIKIKGTSRSTVADAEGKFTLKSVADDAILEVSFIGYESKELKAAGVLNISLKMGTAKLEEVAVLSTGYQTLPKERATGSFVQLGEKELERNVGSDIYSRLRGITPGLLIDQRNTEGKTYLNIRGTNTIFANDQPLIVVDNFPYNGDISTINPNDIQDITILRDAAAASIWGVRAGNGVIVINTKKGKTNSPLNMHFNSNVTVGEKPDLFYQPLISVDDMINVQKSLFQKGYYDPRINSDLNLALSPVVAILNRQRKGEITEQQANSQIDALRGHDVRSDLEKYFYQKPVTQQYALNFSGGAERHTYFVSAGYDKNLLSKVGNDGDRLSLNMSNTFKITSNLSLDARLVYTKSNSVIKNNESDFSFSLDRYTRLTDDNGNPVAIPFNYTPEFQQLMLSRGLLDWTYNPIQELGRQSNTIGQDNLTAAFGASYKIFDGLRADLKYQYELQSSDIVKLFQEDSYITRDLVNKYSVIIGNIVTKRNIPLGGIRDASQNELTGHNGRFQLNFDKIYRNKHRINSLGGFEIRETSAIGYSSRQYGYNEQHGSFIPVDFVGLYALYPNSGFGNIPNVYGMSGTVDRYRSYFANMAYTFNNKYTLSASGRIDQSNLFGVRSNQRSAPLWSAGLKWNVKEDLFKNDRLISAFDFRATYGYNGNVDQNTTAFTTARFAQTSFSQSFAARIINPPNPDLRWEKTATTNLGLDFGIFADRVTGKIEYYSKKGIDLIGNGPLDPTLGFPVFRGNIANMKGKGWDFELNTINTEGMVKWETSLFLSQITDKVTEYKLDPIITYILSDASISHNSNFYAPVVGRPLFGMYSRPYAGLNPATGSPQFLYQGKAVDYKDIMGLGLEYLTYHGRATPEILGGFRNTIEFKRISLSLNLLYRGGYYFRERSINYNQLYLNYTGHADYAKRWRQPGDELITNVPSEIYPSDANRDGYYATSSVLVKKADNIRLQDIRISYDLPQNILSRAKLKQIQLYGFVNNVGILWKAADTPIDPDSPGSNQQRTFAFGASVKF
ncbi:TonB-linked outer membrane protein, SusC/RagA family [Pedobacter insulae]|uniref:TonB-linked outer membrane protein, SusC/RagA family n=1 Tax=Pedobacter insulae TaxID=414048 RepID=A0A1I2VEY8_9SPHI|nr:TonB-linked outer membrane protein, SusC/RagA family [Pedobacter insulae]